MNREINKMKVCKIELIKKTATTKDGRNFNTFKGVQKDGKLIDVKFTKDVKNVPNESGIIVVPVDKINIDKNRKYPVCWVKEIKEFEPKSTTLNTDVTEIFGE